MFWPRPGPDLAAAANTVPAPRRAGLWTAVLWISLGAVAVALLPLREDQPWLLAPPADLTLPIQAWLNVAMAAVVEHGRWMFRALAWIVTGAMGGLRTILATLPWTVTAVLIVAATWFAGGRRLAIFAAATVTYILVLGYWQQTMNTLSLVATAVMAAILLGLILGILGFRSRVARKVIEPTLDLMQAIPTLAYLIPVVLLFGFGPIVGLVASIIYACPPMIRNVMLGLEQVPTVVTEAGTMAGTTRMQHLFLVRVPSAARQIGIGINQTIMTTLSMVILAAIVGGYNDIGWEVLSTVRKSQFGQSLLAGMVIALVAMVLDRTSRAFLSRRPRRTRSLRPTGRLLGALAIAGLLAAIDPAFVQYPAGWELHIAQPLNHAIDWLTINFFWLMDAIKDAVLFFVLFPLKIGLENAVRPHVWGFAMSPEVTVVYVALTILSVGAASRWLGWKAAVGVAMGAILYYVGTTGLPWPATCAAVLLLAWRCGGGRLLAFAAAGLAFILLAGLWQRAMLSVQLAGAAVALCFAIGSVLGIWAALNDRFSAFIRPINDTLQTMPQFVPLIPIMMLFLVGEFSALLAIMIYAIVPPIRYMEVGIRSVPGEVVEAARALGCSRWQLLRHVQLPLARPQILLGLNQTIVMALYMLVVAALVGSLGLGQLVYQGVGNADFGTGGAAGLAIAFIAILADRMIRSLLPSVRTAGPQTL